MPGRPKKRERLKAKGECICKPGWPRDDCPQHGFMAVADAKAEAQLNGEESSAPAPRPTTNHRGGPGASPDRMRELTKIRMEMAKTDPKKKGGRPRTRYSKKEAEDRAMERMVPRALKVLEIQMESEDERVAQTAAVRVLEWTKGKPTQKIEATGNQVHTVVYESAAWTPPVEIETADFKELEEGDA